MEYNIQDFVYGGKYHDEFWNDQFNPNARISDCLADCTTLVYGLCLVENNPVPVTKIVSASQWHLYLANDWTYIPFRADLVKEGDIIQWCNGCHVAKVAAVKDGIIYVNASFYTGEHGRSVYNGKYDTRDSFSTLKEVSDFMVSKYPSRFYHCWDLAKESSAVGGAPEHILVLPDTVQTVPRNENVNQVETTDTDLRIRVAPSVDATIKGHVMEGYYNVLDKVEASAEDKAVEPNLKWWYKISKDAWIGDVTTIYLPAEEFDIIEIIKDYTKRLNDLVKKTTDENRALKDTLAEIHKLSGKE